MQNGASVLDRYVLAVTVVLAVTEAGSLGADGHDQWIKSNVG